MTTDTRVGIDAYLKAVRDIQFRRRDPHQIVHQHHDHDGYKYSKVTDSGSHLQDTTHMQHSDLFSTVKQPFTDGQSNNYIVNSLSLTIQTIPAPAHTEDHVMLVVCGRMQGSLFFLHRLLQHDD